MWRRCAAKRLVYPASTRPGLEASGVWIARSRPTSPVRASSCSGSPLRSSRSRTLGPVTARSEEHTSELQSQSNLVCRLLLEKKKKTNKIVEHDDEAGKEPMTT